MFFGKRGRAAASQSAGAQVMQQHAPQQVTQQPPQQLRVLPAELWDDGPVGKLLRDLGMSPDDESNLVPTGASIDARVARDRARHEAKLAEINRDVAQRTGGGSVMPFFLIPEPCWNGDMGTFFMARLRFFPYDDWNVLFLPADERTAKIMNAPVCPYGEIPGAVDLVQSFVRRVGDEIGRRACRGGPDPQFRGAGGSRGFRARRRVGACGLYRQPHRRQMGSAEIMEAIAGRHVACSLHERSDMRDRHRRG